MKETTYGLITWIVTRTLLKTVKNKYKLNTEEAASLMA